MGLDTQKMIKTVLFTPGPKGHWGLPVLIEGDPGSGKSSILERVAAECGLHCETVIASVREPADFMGLPIPNDGRVEYMPTAWAWRAAKAVRSVGFLDELNTAPEAVQAALLRVVLDRAVGDLQLPKTVRIFAAQNKVEDAAGGHDLAPPLANRFLHWAWDAPSPSEWTDWVLSGTGEGDFKSIDPEALETAVLAMWDPLFAKAKALVTGFISKRAELLHKQPKAGSPESSKAWPSRRSWEMAMRVMAGGEAHRLNPEETEFLIAGCVGTGPIAELLQYVAEADLPDPADLLDGKVKWKADNRLDRTLAVLSSCAALVVSPNCPKKEARAEMLWGMVDEQAKDAADVVLPAAKAMVKARLSNVKGAKKAMTNLQPIFQAAGFLP